MTGRTPPRDRGRVLGLDPGERWIGVAVSDDERRLGLPLATLDRRTLDRSREPAAAAAAEIRHHLGLEGAALVVVGVPYDREGREDAQATAFRGLGEHIAAALELPVQLQSERHTNPAPPNMPAGGRRPGAVSTTRRRRQRRQEHALAAAAILQRWLDADGAH